MRPPSWGLVPLQSAGSGPGQGIVPGARQAAAQPWPTPAQHKPAILGKTKAGRGRAALVSPWWASGPCRTSAAGTGSGALPPLGAANQISPSQSRRGRQEEVQLRALGLLPSGGRPELPVGVRAALSPPWTLCPTCKTNVLSGTFQASLGRAGQPYSRGPSRASTCPEAPPPGPAQCSVGSPARPPYPESHVPLSGGWALGRKQVLLPLDVPVSTCVHPSVHVSIRPSILLGVLFSHPAKSAGLL